MYIEGWSGKEGAGKEVKREGGEEGDRGRGVGR